HRLSRRRNSAGRPLPNAARSTAADSPLTFARNGISLAAIDFQGAGMWRLAMIACGACAISLSSTAQVTQEDQTLQQQLVADSFSMAGDAIAQKFNCFWNTTVTYNIVNNSGMTLYLGFMINSATIGSCTSVEHATGALMLLPSPRATAYSMNPMQGPP